MPVYQNWWLETSRLFKNEKNMFNLYKNINNFVEISAVMPL